MEAVTNPPLAASATAAPKRLGRPPKGDPKAAAAAPRPSAPQPLDVVNIPGALLRIDTMCTLAGRSAATVFKDIAAGNLRAVKMGPRCTRIKAEDAQAYLRYLAGEVAQ